MAVVSMVFALVCYLKYVGAEEQAKKLYRHWQEGCDVNHAMLSHIHKLETDLRHAMDVDHSDDSELWKDL